MSDATPSFPDSTRPASAAPADLQRTSAHPDPIGRYLRYMDIALLSAPARTGKTMLLADWARRLRDGVPICGIPTHPPAFIGVIATDRGWQDHVERYAAVGWPDIPHYSLPDDPSVNWWSFAAQPRLCVEQFKLALAKLDPPPFSVVIMDPITPFIPGDLIGYKLTMVGLLAIRQEVIKRKIALIGTCHQGKAKQDERQQFRRPEDHIYGSAALGGFTDTQLYLMGPEFTERPNYFSLGMLSHQAEGKTVALMRAPSPYSPGHVCFVPWQDQGVEQLERWKLLAVFPTAGTPIATAELLARATDEVGLSRPTCFRYLKALEADGLVCAVSRGVWQRVDQTIPETVQ